MVDQARRQVSNQSLALFADRISILEDGRVRFQTYPYTEDSYLVRRWVGLSKGSHFPKWHRRLCYGGTVTTALHQLVRFVHGKPVVGLASWSWWCGDQVGLAGKQGSDLVELLKPHWPESRCVLCGVPLKGQGLDWWADKKRVGPCCTMRSGCRQQTERKG
jgi:hypothetical protein